MPVTQASDLHDLSSSALFDADVARDRTNGKSIGRDYYGIGFPSLGENDDSLIDVENLEATGKLSQRIGPMLVPANN